MGRILSVAQERPEYRKSRMAGMRAIPDHVGVEQPGGEASKRVLVVDDHAELRAALRDMLLHEGYEVEEAADGAEALDLLAEREFGAAIVDMRMPRVDGLTVLEEIRERGIRCPTLLVAAMAAAATATPTTASTRITPRLRAGYGVSGTRRRRAPRRPTPPPRI
jgi:CheY-like chemotaxis protein